MNTNKQDNYNSVIVAIALTFLCVCVCVCMRERECVYVRESKDIKTMFTKKVNYTNFNA